MRDKSPLAGCSVKIKSNSFLRITAGAVIVIEDWWENVGGKSWMVCNGNPACLFYAMRSGFESLPIDNEVLYGKIGGLGYLVHISELDLEG